MKLSDNLIDYTEYDKARKMFNAVYEDKYSIQLFYNLNTIYIFFINLLKGKNYKLEAIYSKDKTSSELYKGFELLIQEFG